MPDRAGTVLDATDRALVAATAGGLPLEPEPYRRIGEQLGIGPAEVIARLRALLEAGVVRRIGVVPNHYALGYRANGMSVWDVADADIDEAGRLVGALDFVSHCYRRPRHPPQWPYNLFAMVHGRTRPEVEDKVALIATVLGRCVRRHEVLYSTRILKKTGLRVAGGQPAGSRAEASRAGG